MYQRYHCIFPNAAYIIKKAINDSEGAKIILVHFTLDLTHHKSHTKPKNFRCTSRHHCFEDSRWAQLVLS